MGARIISKRSPDAYAKFDSTLAVGNLVEARWTHSHGYYSAPATVVTLNAKSARVQLQRTVKLTGGGGTWVTGHVLTLPRPSAYRWSVNNGVFPYVQRPEYDLTCVGCADNLVGRSRNYLGTIGRGPYCDSCATMLSLVEDD